MMQDMVTITTAINFAREPMQGSLLLSLRWLISTVLALTVVMMLTKRYMDQRIAVPARPPGKKKKRLGGMGESFAVLRSSPMISNVALLVVSYGVSHRLFEFAWKGQLRALFPSAQAYQVSTDAQACSA